jgi:hypothetical protein
MLKSCCSDFHQSRNVSTDVATKLKYDIERKCTRLSVAVIHEDGQTELVKLVVAFWNYLAKAPINVLAIPNTRLKLNTHKKRNTYLLDCIVTTDTIPLSD